MPFEVDTNGTLETNLLRYWRMNEGSGTTTTDAINNAIGTLTNGPTFVAGKVGSNAISFDGVNDFISAAVPTTAQNNWSMSAWAKPAVLIQDTMIVSNGADDGVVANGYAFGMGFLGNSKLIGLYNGCLLYTSPSPRD